MLTAFAGRHLLILGGAGGVGSIAIQLAKKLARLTVIASASRPDSIAWVKGLGADAVVDHTQPLPEQMAALGAAAATPAGTAAGTASNRKPQNTPLAATAAQVRNATIRVHIGEL